MDLTADGIISPDLIDERLPTPLYHQIYMLVRERIVSGELPKGALLPGEQEMAKRLSVSRITVKRAFNELAARGLVDRQRGRGTTVAGDAVIPMVTGTFDTLIESLQRMGLQTDVELLDAQDQPSSGKIAELLEIRPGEVIQRAVRLRRLNGEPFSYLVNYIPLNIARRYTTDDLANTSMLTLLERAGASAREAEQWISAVAAPPAIAAALNLAHGAPLLKIDRLMRGARRRPVQFIEVHYRPDRFHYHIHSQRSGRPGSTWTAGS
jgi:GntR family transcriptional regulator